MTDNEFQKALGGFSIATIITGICIFLFGAGLIALAITGADPKGNSTGQKVFLVLFGILCAAVGGLILFVQIRTSRWIKQGRHPLINAIKSGDTSFVLWFYEQIFKVKNGGSSYQIWIMCNGNRHFIINLGFKNSKAADIMKYLTEKFPSAVQGYSKENEDFYNRTKSAC